MAIRNIIKEGDPILNKKCRSVDRFDNKLEILLDDMLETMYKFDGAGLAAPQVGILRCAVVIDVGDGPVELINPTILKQSGEQKCVEGCLSLPGQWGITKRPSYVKVRAQNRKGDFFELDAKDYFADACCHEIDHLSGILFNSLAIRMLSEEELEKLK